MSSRGLMALVLVVAVSAVLQGCSAENPKSGVPVQPGDYAGAPGTVNGHPGAGPVAPAKNPNK